MAVYSKVKKQNKQAGNVWLKKNRNGKCCKPIF